MRCSSTAFRARRMQEPDRRAARVQPERLDGLGDRRRPARRPAPGRGARRARPASRRGLARGRWLGELAAWDGRRSPSVFRDRGGRLGAGIEHGRRRLARLRQDRRQIDAGRRAEILVRRACRALGACSSYLQLRLGATGHRPARTQSPAASRRGSELRRRRRSEAMVRIHQDIGCALSGASKSGRSREREVSPGAP